MTIKNQFTWHGVRWIVLCGVKVWQLFLENISYPCATLSMKSKSHYNSKQQETLKCWWIQINYANTLAAVSASFLISWISISEGSLCSRK